MCDFKELSETLRELDQADFAMYNQLSALPLPTSAQFPSQSSLRIVFSVRDHLRNVKRAVTRTVTLPPPTISTAYEDVSSDIVLSLISPSKSYRAVLRDLSKIGSSGRFVEIWNKDRLVVSKEVTRAHGQFYSDGTSSPFVLLSLLIAM
jgi:acylaminoacyl-peptidase